MLYKSKHLTTRTARGFSLIELMVSLTIGLVIVVAAMSAYVGSSEASKMSEAQARMNEDAQAALGLLTRELKLAGTNPAQPNRSNTYQHNPVFATTYLGGSASPYGATTATPAGVVPTTTLTYRSTGSPTAVGALNSAYALATFAVRGCDGNFTNITTAATPSDLTCTAGATSAADSIAISYEADKFNTTPTSAAEATDCVGSRLNVLTTTVPSGPLPAASYPQSVAFSVADNRYYIDNTTAGVPNLYCKGSSSSTQPLVENVENLQLSYGLVNATTISSTATVAGYLSANEFATTASLAALTDDATRWGRVMAVQICVIVRSAEPVLSDTASGSYYNCNGDLDTTKTDRRLRHAYTTTVVLRNRRS